MYTAYTDEIISLFPLRSKQAERTMGPYESQKNCFLNAVCQLSENWAVYLKISPYMKKYVLVITHRYIGILK